MGGQVGTLEIPFGPPPEDLKDAALTERVPLGSCTLSVHVSPVRQHEDYGPQVDVVRAWALQDDGTPVTLRDLYPHVSRQEAYRLWTFFCDQLVAAARLTYGLRPDPAPNPTLGCWGPRPDLIAAGIDDDSATAMMVGVAIDNRAATRPRRHRLLILAVRSALITTLRYWLAASLGAHRGGSGAGSGRGAGKEPAGFNAPTAAGPAGLSGSPPPAGPSGQAAGDEPGRAARRD